jgi:predicted protein tyrosine phosphatase
MIERFHILFVCGKNQWRSPTGERVYQNDVRFDVRSAGLSKVAKRRLSAHDLVWADLVFVMERKQKRRIVEQFSGCIELPEVICLEIPDIYPFMDPDLISLIKEGVEDVLLDLE